MTAPAGTSTLQIPKDVIEPIIMAHVQAAIVSGLGGHTAILEAAIARTLNAKVDQDGKPTSSSYNTSTFLEWLVSDAIRKATTEAVREHITAQLPALRAQLAKELRSAKSPIVNALMEGLTNVVKSHAAYHISVNVLPKAPER